jgi:transcriptional regulator with XRE-family HTH domain
MEHQISIGEQIKASRQKKNLSQLELANKCNLNIRTVQRIESNQVEPRLYTLRVIGEALNIKLTTKDDLETEDKQLEQLRRIFERRKQIRLITFVVAILLLASALILIFSGLPKYKWAPFIYIFFFIDLIVIGLSWRCPGCNKILGDVFNVKYCSNCGLKFSEN